MSVIAIVGAGPGLGAAVAQKFGHASFATRWAKHDARRHSRGRKLIEHAEVGRLDLEFNDFALPGLPHISIATYTAASDGVSAAGLKRLVAAHRNVVPRLRSAEQHRDDIEQWDESKSDETRRNA